MPGILLFTSYLGSKYQITPAQGKALNLSNEWMIQSPTVELTAQELWTPRFRPFRALDWIYTVSMTIKVVEKLVNSPQWFLLLHDGNLNVKHIVFWCSTLTFDWSFCSFGELNLMHKIDLSLSIKYDESRNQNNIVMKNLNCGFWFN